MPRKMYVVTISKGYGDARIDSVWPSKKSAEEYLGREWHLVPKGKRHYGMFGNGVEVKAVIQGPVSQSPAGHVPISERLVTSAKVLPLPMADERVAIALYDVHDVFGDAHVTSVLSGETSAYVGFDAGRNSYATGAVVYDDGCLQWVNDEAPVVTKALGLGDMRPHPIPPVTDHLASVVYRSMFYDATVERDLSFVRHGDGSVDVIEDGQAAMTILPDYSVRE